MEPDRLTKPQGDASNRSQLDVWEGIWRKTGLTEKRVRDKLRFEQTTMRWKAIRKAFVREFGSIQGLRTIELGAGTGDISMLLAAEGAKVTLFDASERALDIARFQLGVFGFEPEFVVGNFFELPDQVRGRFDAAVSYGVVEHFRGEDRYLAWKAHADTLRPGGMVAVSVPNALCLPYRLNKWRQEVTGTWPWGLEIPYTRAEMHEMAKRLGLAAWHINGSSFLRDWDQFLLTPITARITGLTGFSFEKWTPFDRWFGHAQTLIGRYSSDVRNAPRTQC